MNKVWMIYYERPETGDMGVISNPARHPIIQPFLISSKEEAVEYAKKMDKKYKGQGYVHYPVELVPIEERD